MEPDTLEERRPRGAPGGASGPGDQALAREILAFERAYVERARRVCLAQIGGGQPAVILPDRRRPPKPPDGAALLAGWWVRDAGKPEAVVLPNPWDRRDAIDLFEQFCWRLTTASAASLGASLDAIHGTERSPDYWRVLLSPWLLHLVSAIVDRRLYVVTTAQLVPGGSFATGAVPPPPATMAAGVQLLRSDTYMSSLMTLLVEALGHSDRRLPQGPADDIEAASASTNARAALAFELFRTPGLAFAAGLRAAMRPLAARATDRRISVVGEANFTPTDVLRLRRHVRGIALAPTRPEANAIPAGRDAHTDAPARARLRFDATDDVVELLAAMLPRVAPRSLVEDFGKLTDQSLRGYGSPSHVVVEGYSARDVQNEFLGRCCAAGKQLIFSQHGGTYLQARVNSQERLEISTDGPFVSWGGTGTGVHPLANPRLERRRDRHRGGRDVVLIEPLVPPDVYLLRFASAPLGNQAHEPAQLLAEFIQHVDRARPWLKLKRFPSASHERPQALTALPHFGRRRLLRGPECIRRSRLTVISYPDTSLIEAMVLGTPLLGLWNPSHWEPRADVNALYQRLTSLGVFFSDPAAAAHKLDEVFANADAWWAADEIQAARHDFVARLAVPGDWLSDWSGLLSKLP